MEFRLQSEGAHRPAGEDLVRRDADPFSAIDTRTPEKGRELRIGMFRIAGANPRKRYLWQPTGQTSFHVPQAFGILRLN